MLRGRECVWWTSENLFTLSLVWLKDETLCPCKILYSLLWCNAIFWTALLQLISFRCTVDKLLSFVKRDVGLSEWDQSVSVFPQLSKSCTSRIYCLALSIFFAIFLAPVHAVCRWYKPLPALQFVLSFLRFNNNIRLIWVLCFFNPHYRIIDWQHWAQVLNNFWSTWVGEGVFS